MIFFQLDSSNIALDYFNFIICLLWNSQMLYLTSVCLNLPMHNSNSAFLKASSKLPAPLPISNKFLASGIILFAASATSSKEIFESTIEICLASRFEKLYLKNFQYCYQIVFLLLLWLLFSSPFALCVTFSLFKI